MRIVEYMPVSRAGARREVSALDPSVLPRWRTTFRVGADELSSARERLGELLSRLPLSGDALFDMGLACGEALGNAVDHTCADGVLATVAAYPDRVCVEVSDCGCGFELAEGDEPPEAGPEDERGRGIRLMRMLADSVSIMRKRTGEGDRRAPRQAARRARARRRRPARGLTPRGHPDVRIHSFSTVLNLTPCADGPGTV